jgi:hypothetical protein
MARPIPCGSEFGREIFAERALPRRFPQNWRSRLKGLRQNSLPPAGREFAEPSQGNFSTPAGNSQVGQGIDDGHDLDVLLGARASRPLFCRKKQTRGPRSRHGPGLAARVAADEVVGVLAT